MAELNLKHIYKIYDKDLAAVKDFNPYIKIKNLL